MNLRKKKLENSLIDSLEEATELLRRVPVAAWTWWFGGSLPFIVALLHFWNDMSRSARAWDNVGRDSFVLVMLFIFMKVCHAYFGDQLLRYLRDEPVPYPLSFRGKIRLVSSQALIHAFTPWLLPLAFAAMLPFSWAYASFHNVSILSLQVLRDGGRTRDILKLALRQSHYRAKQNHGVMIILLIFASMVLIGLFAGTLLVSTLATSFTGSENFITRNPWILMSSGVWATLFCATYLICGPLVKAVYALRCFYGLSRKTGEDLAVKFRRAVAASTSLMLLFLAVPSFAQAQSAPPQAPPSAEELDRQIKDVLAQDEFQWRMPREERNSDPGWIKGFVEAIAQAMKDFSKWLEGLLEDGLVAWLKDWLNKMDKDEGTTDKGLSTWTQSVEGILWITLGLLLIALLVLLFRQWRQMPPAVASAPSDLPDVNLESDTIVATQLPENEWLRLAQEKMASGDYRLAMRALFLATLAHLGERKMVAISRWKSNGDYRHELSFRARENAPLRDAFEQSVRAFDHAWYGWHDVSREMLDRFIANHETILTHGDAR